MASEPVERDRLHDGLGRVREAPVDAGPIELIVRRPAVDGRELVESAELDREHGLIGDRWSRGEDGADNDQVTVIGSRAAALFADSTDPAAWAPAGDQLYVDLDLSEANLPAGTRLSIGEVVMVEVTDEPHLGCGKFVRRFGVEAMKLANSEIGRELRLRGLHVRVIEPGTVRRGDRIVVRRS